MEWEEIRRKVVLAGVIRDPAGAVVDKESATVKAVRRPEGSERQGRRAPNKPRAAAFVPAASRKGYRTRDGLFFFCDLPAGSYSVRVDHEDKEQRAEGIAELDPAELKAREIAKLDLELVKVKNAGG